MTQKSPQKGTQEIPDIVIPFDVALEILHTLGETYIWTLLGSEHESELGEDFKPWKWQGYEIEHADRATAAFRDLMKRMQAAVGEGPGSSGT